MEIWGDGFTLHPLAASSDVEVQSGVMSWCGDSTLVAVSAESSETQNLCAVWSTYLTQRVRAASFENMGERISA